jgi:hypothetical protein
MKKLRRILEKQTLTKEQEKLLKALALDFKEQVNEIIIEMQREYRGALSRLSASERYLSKRIDEIDNILSEAGNRFYPSPKEFYDVVVAARILLKEKRHVR